jgi:uncharacterized protein
VALDAATVPFMGGAAEPNCPICGRDVSKTADTKSRPFCSPRCKLIDLDRWFSGSYRVPGPPVESSGMEDGVRAGNDVDADHSYEHKGDEDL